MLHNSLKIYFKKFNLFFLILLFSEIIIKGSEKSPCIEVANITGIENTKDN